MRPHPTKLLILYVVVASLVLSWLGATQAPANYEKPLAYDAVFETVTIKVPISPKPTSPTRSSWRRSGSQKPMPAPKPPAAVQAAPGTVQAQVAAAWPGDDAWALAVVRCESGFNFRQYGGLRNGNCCWGGWQFMLSTWRGVGGSGNPIDASVTEQTQRAWTLFSRSGAGQWSCP